MAEFISTYKGIKYKVPESDKVARFERGRLATQDEQVISYLREHPDYGINLTEVENPSRKTAMTVNTFFCPVEGCGRVFQSEAALRGHMKVHKNEGTENPGDGPGDDAGDGDGDPLNGSVE